MSDLTITEWVQMKRSGAEVERGTLPVDTQSAETMCPYLLRWMRRRPKPPLASGAIIPALIPASRPALLLSNVLSTPPSVLDKRKNQRPSGTNRYLKYCYQLAHATGNYLN